MTPELATILISTAFMIAPLIWLLLFLRRIRRIKERHRARIAAMQQQFANTKIVDRGALDADTGLATIVYPDGRKEHFLLDEGKR